MAFLTRDRVKETATTTGTGTLALLGAVANFRAFSAVLANNDTTTYAIVHRSAAEWEVGIGTWTTGNNLARTTVIASSTGSAVSFSAGTKDVFMSDVAQGPIELSSFINIAEISEPATPQSQSARVYAEDRLGRTVLRYKTPGGNRFQLAQDNVLVVRNQSGATINPFSVVYESGTGGSGEPLISLAKADSGTTMPALGVTVESIGNNANGFVMLFGVITDVNTSGFSSGDILYVSPTTAGAFTTTAPVTPGLTQRVARVLSSHASTGAALIVNRGQRGLEDPAILSARDTDPATPPADTLELYGKYIAGRAMLKQKGPSGLDTPLQPALFQNTVRLVSPNTTTTFSLIGGAVTTVGTISHPTPTATSYGLSPQVVTAATINTGGGTSDALLYFLRGDGTAGQASGFFYACRFWFNAAGDIVNSGVFMGMSNGSLVQMTASSAPSQVYCGLHQHDAAAAPRDTKFAFVTRNAGTVVVVDTTQVITIGKLYDFYMFSPPYAGAAPVLSMQLINQTDGVSSTHTFPNTEAQLPPATTLMRSITTTLTTEAVAKNIRIKKIYIETDL